MNELLNHLPDEYFKGVGMIATFFMPAILAWMYRTAKREARLEYDLDNLGAILGTEKGLDRVAKRKAREETGNFLARMWQFIGNLTSKRGQ